MYFPGWWLLGVLRVPATLRVLTTIQVAHVLFGSMGILALARARRLAWPWATVAAVAYIFSEDFTGRLSTRTSFGVLLTYRGCYGL